MSRYSGDIDRMKNQISSIRGKINQLQREINVIQNEITALGTSSANANAQLVNNVNKINSTLSNNKNVVEYSHSQLSKTFSTQLQIREMFFIFKDIEGANKTIRALTNDLYFNYKNQATIRKIVRGFIDNLDLNMVSDETIYKMLEKEYLQSPEYWLAYVLLAIMNWKNDIQEKVEECNNLDRRTTTISIDQIIGGDDNSISLVEKIEDESQKEAFNSYENRMILDDAIKRLDEVEQQLIILNYYEGLNQREISEKLNISQMQVSRKLKKALQKLFEIISKKGLKQYE